MPHFSKMSGDKSGPKSASTSYVFQILGNIRKQQQAIYTMYNQNELDTTKTSYPDPEPHPSFRTTTPSQRPAPMTGTSRQANPVHVHAFPVQNTSQSGPPAPCAHVHNLPKQVCKPGELLALRKVQHPHNGRTSVTRFPLMKQDILSHYSSCFEGIGHFPESQGTHRLGQFICNSGKGLRRLPLSKSHYQEETEDLFGSKGPE